MNGTVYRDHTCSEKDDNNAEVVSAAAGVLRANAGRALVLDGASMRTSRALAAAFGDSVHVEVPERVAKQVPSMRRVAPGNATVVPARLDAWLKTRERVPLDVVYYDCMGTVMGCRSEACFPLQDICDVLTHHVAREVVLAGTFSSRVKSLGRHRSALAMTRFFLRQVINYAGFKVKAGLHVRSYSRNGTRCRRKKAATMIFFRAHLVRVCAVGRKDARFECTVVDKRVSDGTPEVCVEWAGFPGLHWIPETNIVRSYTRVRHK